MFPRILFFFSAGLFPLLIQAQGNCLIRIQVTDMAGNARAGETVMLAGLSSGKTFQCISDRQGVCECKVPNGDRYKPVIHTLSGPLEYDVLTIPAGSSNYEAEVGLQYEASKTTVVDVLFMSGSAEIKTQSYPNLDNMVSILKNKPAMEIEIAGHTDNVGNDKANQDLSQRRAEAVKKYLVNHGISESRIVAKGYGESRPVESNDTEDGRAKNRRTEVWVLKE